MKKYYFAVDIGGTHSKYGMFSKDGHLLEKWTAITRKEDGGKYVLEDAARAVLKKCSEENIKPERVGGIGLGLPGPADEKGVINGCVNLGWKTHVDVPAKIESLTGIRAAAGNDATLAAFGEYHANDNANGSNTIVMTIGTGIGGGLIANDRILTGAHGAAGEIGHIRVTAPDAAPCTCGRFGCLEQYASATGIVRLMKKELLSGSRDSVLRYIKGFECKDVVDAAKAGDEAAAYVMEEVFGYLGEAAASMCCVFDPKCVIVGGGVSQAGEYLIKGIERKFKEKCFHACSDTDFYLARLGNNAGLYGAFRLIRGHHI